MKINILEDITPTLAASVLTKVEANKDKEIEVNIFSYGGDVMSGNAIISALKLSPAKVTTKVYGMAASMASAISQAGDVRMIAEDALFQPHYGAGMPVGRPTKENLMKVANSLEIVDAILLKSFGKSNLSEDKLKDLLSEDKPITAKDATSMAFFDSIMQPIEAAAYLNKLEMENENGLMTKLQAIKDKFSLTAAEEIAVDPAPTEESVVEEVDDATVSRDEFDKLLALVESLIEKMSPLDAPSVTETVSAKVEEIFKAMKSTDTMPTASAADLDAEEVEIPEVGFLEARQKEIQSKFNK